MRETFLGGDVEQILHAFSLKVSKQINAFEEANVLTIRLRVLVLNPS